MLAKESGKGRARSRSRHTGGETDDECLVDESPNSFTMEMDQRAYMWECEVDLTICEARKLAQLQSATIPGRGSSAGT